MARYWSIRWKCCFLVACVGFVLAAADLWVIPNRVASQEEEDLRERARGLAEVLAAPLGAAMAADPPAETLAETLRSGQGDRLVDWSAVYDSTGRRIAAVGEEKAPETVRAFERRGRETTLVGTADVRVKGRPDSLGTVAVALSRDLVDERRAAARNAMAPRASIIVALGIAAAWFFSDRMARSMQRIARAAGQIARGDVSRPFDVEFPADELGDIANGIVALSAELRQLQESAVRVAGGDLTGTIRGEGELFAAFRNMVDSLRQLATRIGNSSSSVASAAVGMFSSIRQQEATATQQNTALEEIRRTVETLAASAEHVAEDASVVREMAQRSLVSTQHTAEQTKLVSAHSDRIGEILSLIQDIADKSDLLALNAALEGTKAGEVGRGFSLVAAEMRRLSEHVMDSVRDIRRLVADMHHASRASVIATEEGIKLAREAAAAAAKISEAVARQREGTSQVKTAVIDVVSAVNDSLNGNADTTRSAESLLQLSHDLKVAAKNFRVGAHDSVELPHESPR